MKKKVTIPEDLAQLKQKFDLFRETRKNRILDPSLLGEAVVLAKEYGVAPVAKTLKLNYSRFKARLNTYKNDGSKNPKRTKVGQLKTRGPFKPQFVELPRITPQARNDVKIELIAKTDHRMTIEMRSPSAEVWENLFLGLIRAERESAQEGAK